MKLIVGFLFGVIVASMVVATRDRGSIHHKTHSAQRSAQEKPKPAPVVAPEPLAPAIIERPSEPEFADLFKVSVPPTVVPAMLRSSKKPEYPAAARRAGIEGSALCRIHISATGEVSDVELIESSGSDTLDDAAKSALMQWQFRPQMRGDDAEPSTLDHRVRFALKPGEREIPAQKSTSGNAVYIESAGTAWAAAQSLIESEKLRSPSSAEWPTDGFLPAHSYTEFVTYMGDGKYIIRSWVDADNAFGAKIRTRFVATVQDHGGYDWRLTSFETID
jgi:TonB family protein